ncbi:hypothetical protein OCGS_1140 [Oceaniovalibus guishaninsula JLT2003]|uniref:HdeA/HdeB family protein n=1 Tax=Oceaniovalibus guishaninsula JLT2003 TaxID=1231392 RepID=K2HDZ3_9RHOB|nr:hypothetical protein [Oceaniovalibus guishaninsula]EKE44757.1 hypothetical protein OCGS_1140 [Oceaniovalibus guishaninsula JLT2003]
MFRPFIAAAVPLALLALTGPASAQTGMTCAEFIALDIEAQKRTLSELAEDGGGEVPPESLIAGEEQVTLIVAACAADPDAALTDKTVR